MYNFLKIGAVGLNQFLRRKNNSTKKAFIICIMKASGGERGIRTPGPVTVNSFQDCRNRPLCHLSVAKIGLQANKKNNSIKTFF